MPYETSEYITDFLAFLNAADEMLHDSISGREKTEDAILDIEHYLEICPTNAAKSAKAAKKLKELRKERRRHKDNIDICKPIVEWAKNNQHVIISLGKLSKAVRDVEKSQQNRRYRVRTDALKDICPDEYLTSEAPIPTGTSQDFLG